MIIPDKSVMLRVIQHSNVSVLAIQVFHLKVINASLATEESKP